MQDMKKKFAGVLVNMLEQKTLDKITIKDIVAACSVSRQAFYYYFDDIYDIVEWIFLEAAGKVLEDYSDIDSWQFGYRSLMYWTKSHAKLVSNVYRSIQREYIETFMNTALRPYIDKVVELQAKGMNVTQAQKEFIANYFTLSFNAVGLDWIRRGMQEEPDDIVRQLDILVKGDFQKALRNFEEANQAGSSRRS